MFTRLSYALAISVMTIATLLGVAVASAILMDTAGFINLSHFNGTTWPNHFPFIGGRTVMEGIARITLFAAFPILALSLYFTFFHLDADNRVIQPVTRNRWGAVVIVFGLAVVFLWMVRPTIAPVASLKTDLPEAEPAYKPQSSLKLFKPCDKGMCSDINGDK